MCTLRSLEETATLIQAGKRLLLAGDEGILTQLPVGEWVAGTSPYFVTADGRMTVKDRIAVTVLPPSVTATDIRFYDGETIQGIASDGPAHGFSFLIVPGFSALLQQFADHQRLAGQEDGFLAGVRRVGLQLLGDCLGGDGDTIDLDPRPLLLAAGDQFQ